MKRMNKEKPYIAIVLKHSVIQEEYCETFEKAADVLKHSNNSGQAYPIAIIHGDTAFFPVDEESGLKRTRQLEDWEMILKSAGKEYNRTETFKLPE